MNVNIGIKSNECVATVKNLSLILGNTYLLYVKTQNFHWNVKSPLFPALHKMFEEQYIELSEAIDVIAERIRSLGQRTPASLGEFLKLATLKEETREISAVEMIQQLLKDHEEIIKQVREIFDSAEKSHDEATADLYAERLREHEKVAWMLRSSLEG